METSNLIFTTSPVVEVCTNYFQNVPVILRVDGAPIIEVVQEIELKPLHKPKIPIYHSDGTKLAVVVGSRLIATEEGKKAGVVLRHPANKIVCEVEGKTLFELERKGPAALSVTAELYTPVGSFVKCTPSSLSGQVVSIEHGKPLQIGSVFMTGNMFRGCAIGIDVRSDGSVGIGCGG